MTLRKRKRLLSPKPPSRRLRPRSSTNSSIIALVKEEFPPIRRARITLTDCIKDLELRTSQKDITSNSRFKIDDSGKVASVISKPNSNPTSSNEEPSIHEEIAKLKAEVETLKKQAFRKYLMSNNFLLQII